MFRNGEIIYELCHLWSVDIGILNTHNECCCTVAVPWIIQLICLFNHEPMFQKCFVLQMRNFTKDAKKLWCTSDLVWNFHHENHSELCMYVSSSTFLINEILSDLQWEQINYTANLLGNLNNYMTSGCNTKYKVRVVCVYLYSRPPAHGTP